MSEPSVGIPAAETHPKHKRRTRKVADAPPKGHDPLAFMDADRRALSTVRQYVTNLKKKATPNATYIRKFITGICEAVEKK